jgi:hypothetical protein
MVTHQRDTGLRVEDGRGRVSVHVGGDDIVLSVGEDASEGTGSGLLDGGLDVLVGGGLLEADSQVHNGDVLGGHTHGHTGELAVKLGDDLADSLWNSKHQCSMMRVSTHLGGTGAAGDDVGSSGTSSTPVLGGGTVDGLLGGGVRVNGGHETLNDAELVVQDLGEGSQAVGGARSVGQDVDVLGVLVEVDTADEHGGVGRRGRAISRQHHTMAIKSSGVLT